MSWRPPETKSRGCGSGCPRVHTCGVPRGPRLRVTLRLPLPGHGKSLLFPSSLQVRRAALVPPAPQGVSSGPGGGRRVRLAAPEQASYPMTSPQGATGGFRVALPRGQFSSHGRRQLFSKCDSVTGVVLVYPPATPLRVAGVRAACWQPFLRGPVPEAAPLPALPQDRAPGQLAAGNVILAARALLLIVPSVHVL